MTSRGFGAIPSEDVPFTRLAGLAAIGAGVAGFAYSAAFLGLVVLEAAPAAGALVSAVALMTGAVLSVITYTGLYRILVHFSGGAALVALLLGVIGGFGALIHGGYDLAVALNPPSGDLGAAGELPNPIDPRGLLTFGVAGIAALVLSSLLVRHPLFPSALGYLGYLAGVLLVAVYLGRLIILEPTNPLVGGPAAVLGLVVSPAFYAWLGITLRRSG